MFFSKLGSFLVLYHAVCRNCFTPTLTTGFSQIPSNAVHVAAASSTFYHSGFRLVRDDSVRQTQANAETTESCKTS